MKTKYYIYHPRNFGNEYDTIKATTEEEVARLNEFANSLDYIHSKLYRITLKELKKYISEEKRARKYDQSFSGYCSPWEPISVSEFLKGKEDLKNWC